MKLYQKNYIVQMIAMFENVIKNKLNNKKYKNRSVNKIQTQLKNKFQIKIIKLINIKIIRSNLLSQLALVSQNLKVLDQVVEVINKLINQININQL